jgi:phytoene synthase
MMVESPHWETELLKKALYPRVHTENDFTSAEDEARLKEAYQACAVLTRKHSQTFYLTSGLLGGSARNAARALYAFCRITDDIVDENSNHTREELMEWRNRSLKATADTADPELAAWGHTRTKYSIPLKYAEQLLDGVGMDLVKTRYANFTELTHYCYGVASTVGLMTMHIIGYQNEAALPYAIKLGVALQLTNILRDIGEDWANGRLYLPQDELAMYGLDETDIAAGVVDDRWRAFMKFQIERNRRLYEEALPGIAMLGKRGQFAITASAVLYQDILAAIENNDYDVFTLRAHLTGREKLVRLPGIWQTVFQLRRNYRTAWQAA